MKTPKSALKLVLLPLFLSVSTAALAADRNWNGNDESDKTDWFRSGNWDSSTVPRANDRVFIDAGDANPAVVNGLQTPQLLSVDVGNFGTGILNIENGGVLNSFGFGVIGATKDAVGVVNVSGLGAAWNSLHGVSVGRTGTGELNILDGGLVKGRQGFIGLNLDSKGTVNVVGSGSTWDISNPPEPYYPANNYLYVGHEGTGVLNIENGGLVKNAAGFIGYLDKSVGTVKVTGLGSQWTNSRNLLVGQEGTGTLIIQDGGLVSNTEGFIGYGSGSKGNTVQVTGPESIWNNRSGLYVGYGGNGTLNIENGGLVKNSLGVIGYYYSSKENIVKVTGVGSQWSNDSQLHVGTWGTGTLIIENGGLVKNTSGIIARYGGSKGIVMVTGVGSQWNNNGQLQVGSGSAGALTISNGGLVTNTSGIVGLSAGSNGTVMVTGAGSEWINSDWMQVGRSDTGRLTISDGGLVTNTRGYIGRMSGSNGTVNITGAGSKWNNTEWLTVGFIGTGTLTLSDGGLVDVGLESAGPVFLASNPSLAALDFDNAIGTINFGAASGEIAMAPGALNAASVEFGDGTGTLVFNHTDETGNYAFEPGVESAGTGTHTILHEAGYTNFNGDGSLFTGTTTINGGIFAVNNALSGLVEVYNGGTLGGSGTLGGTVNIFDGGIVAPGNSIGTMRVNNVNFNAGTFFAVEVDETPNVDLLEVTGTAILAGGTVTAFGIPSVTDTYTILTSENNELTDEFAGVTDTVFIDYSLSYDTNNVYLTAARTLSTICNVANSANQQSLACDGINSLPLTDELLITLYGLTKIEEVRAAYDALSGEIHPSLAGALMVNNWRKVDATKNRLQAGFAQNDSETSIAALGYFASPASPAEPTEFTNGVWATGYGSWGETDTTLNTAQMDTDLRGVVFGLDREAFDNMRLGILGGYSRTDLTQSARSSSGAADTWSLGVYGGVELGGATLSFGGIHNWHAIDTARNVSFTGFSQDLNASYQAQSLQLFAEAGHKMQVHTNAMVEPFAAIRHISIDTDGFSETGGSAALTAAADTQSTTFTTLGARGSMAISNKVRAIGSAGWRHAFGDINPTSSFTLSGSNPFIITGAPIAENAFVSELGIETDLPGGAIASASYFGQAGSGTTAHGADLTFKMLF